MGTTQATPETGQELSAFLPSDPGSEPRAVGVAAEFRYDLLLFEYDHGLYGVEAARVVSVVPWKSPVMVPGVDTRVRGVIQDRGRIVVVMAHPAARVEAPPSSTPTRIIVCATDRGHIGLPASATRDVRTVELHREPTSQSVHESELGPFIYLDPSRYGRREVASGGSAPHSSAQTYE